jgi:hypothetical protein
MKIRRTGKIAWSLIIVLLLSTSCATTRYSGSAENQRRGLMLEAKPDYSAKKTRRRSIKSSRKSLMLPKEQKRSKRKMRKSMRSRRR